VAYCLTHYDAFAAARSGRPFVFHYPGLPVKRAFRTYPLDALMFERARRKAAVVAVVSRSAAEQLAADYGVEARVLPPPVDLARFRPCAPDPSRPPTLLMVGAMEERRKGARLLVRAFGRIKREIPDLRLRLSGQISPGTTAELLALVPSEYRGDVEVLGAGRVEDLPGLYAGASVTVLPAVWETLGLVLIESLASGTPVVGANHGGIPDIVTSADVGELFEPGATRREADNLEGLEAAIRRALALVARPETAGRCRQAAEPFGWTELGPRYERLLAEAVS
jgi:glycosyltransferase involved in cell wall biosynthesis